MGQHLEHLLKMERGDVSKKKTGLSKDKVVLHNIGRISPQIPTRV